MMFSNVSFSNYNTIISSDAYRLNVTFSGDSNITLQTTKGANGSNGESYGAFQIGNGGRGGNGSDANIPVVCSGMLNIICGTNVTILGGDGGNGGNGGSSKSSGSVGGVGGNGGNGAVAIYSNDITVTFIGGTDQGNISLRGGSGGSGGIGGTGKGAFWIGSNKAADGNPGSSALATNVPAKYN